MNSVNYESVSIKNEKTKILYEIDKLLKSNSENFKIRKYIYHIYPENEFVCRYYDYLIDIYNDEFEREIELFNSEDKDICSDFDNGKILKFIDSTTYKKFYNEYFEGMNKINDYLKKLI